jgi:AraC-like DNA-binding protein
VGHWREHRGLRRIQALTAPPVSDPLGAIIALLRPQTVLSKVISGAGEWSIRYGQQEDPGFSIILSGSCLLDAGDVGVIELRQGDFVLLPQTSGFTLATDLTLEPRLVTGVHTREIRHGVQTGPSTMRMLGGWCRFDRPNAQLLVKLLPPVIHIRRDEPGASRLRSVVELIGDEAGACHPGHDLILERLVEVLLIEALRFRQLSPATRERGLLAGLSDPGLARALRAIHADVARPWTVAALARVALMSRAVFAERFARTVGMPPMQYLLEWRMAIAKDLLRRERPPLALVAASVGYQSASAFSTAFSRLSGSAPSEFARLTD